MEEIKKEHEVLFGKLMRKHNYEIHRICNKYGLYKGQHPILKAIEAHPGLTQQELADEINAAKASITTSLNRMEKHGFVYRKRCQEDGRCNRIYITDAGLQASHACEKEISEFKQVLFSKLDDDQLEILNGFLEKLIAGVEAYRENQ